MLLLLFCCAVSTLFGCAAAAEQVYSPLWRYGACDAVTSVAITEDGSTIVAGAGATVYLMDRNGTVLWQTGVGSQVNGVGISPEGSYIGVAADKLYLFDRNGNTLWTVKTKFVYKSVALSFNGTYIATGCDNGALYIFDRNKETLWDYDMGTDAYGVAISEGGKNIVVGCDNQGVYLLRSQKGEIWSYGTGNLVKSVAISPNGKYIAAGSYDRCAYLSTSQGEHLWKFPSQFPVKAVALSGEAMEVFAASGTKVYVLNRQGGVIQNMDLGCQVETLASSADGSILVVGSSGSGQSVHLFTKDSTLIDEENDSRPETTIADESAYLNNTASNTTIYSGPQTGGEDEGVEMNVEPPGEDVPLTSQIFGWVENFISLLFEP